jgi:Na+/H+ antiporter NhaD/arsenite permease-like protein
MVARPWGWDIPFMILNFGWRAVVAIAVSTVLYLVLFRRELRALAARAPVADVERPDEEATGPALLPVPAWLVLAHLAFMAWTVFNAHYPALFLAGFCSSSASSVPRRRTESNRAEDAVLVGFFLAGLVIHSGLQGWWSAPVLSRLPEAPLFLGATALTAVNDNALITYLATLVPNLGDELKLAVVQGAAVGGGLTVIANAPNPAGQVLLGRFFEGAISPLGLLGGAIVPTVIAGVVFRLR